VAIDLPGDDEADWARLEIDTSVAHVARVYDWLLGGGANFAVDRAAAERAYAAWPGGIAKVRADALAHRAMLGRVVRYLVREGGIRQFLDIGTGIPKQNNVHEVAQREAPEARVVYVDHDPIVLAHAHQLLRGNSEGATQYVFGELREPAKILEAAAKTLDFGQPVAVLLFGVLHFFDAAGDPAAVAGQLMAPLVPGSYLALSHLAADVSGDEMAETFRRLNEKLADTVVLRSRDEFGALFGGLELVEPGIVQLPDWWPEPDEPSAGPVPVWCGVGRKNERRR
jgi:hypothetical protein